VSLKVVYFFLKLCSVLGGSLSFDCSEWLVARRLLALADSTSMTESAEPKLIISEFITRTITNKKLN